MADDASPAGRPMVGKIKSDQDHEDLITYHLSVLRLAEAAVATAKGPVDEAKAVLADANEELTKAFNAAKADLGRGYDRKYLEGLLLDGRTKITVLVEREKQRARDKAALRQPVYGLQEELFPGEETPAEARDEMAYRHEGFQRGLNGELSELRDGDPPRFHQAIMAGFREGQELAQARFVRAQEAKKASEMPDAGAAAKDLNAEPGTPEAEAQTEESVARAKESLAAMGADGAEASAALQDGTPLVTENAEIARLAASSAPAKPARGRRAAAGVH